VVETYNRAVWPVQVVAYALALALVWLAMRPRYGGDRLAGHKLAGAALAAAWGWTGTVFHLKYFAAVNFLAPVYGALFIVQAFLLAWTAAIRGRIASRAQSDPFGWAGLGLVVYAIIGYPLIAEVAGDGLQSAPVVGLAPGPTAVFTLGVLLLVEGRTPLHLTVVPVLCAYRRRHSVGAGCGRGNGTAADRARYTRPDRLEELAAPTGMNQRNGFLHWREFFPN
jgi:Family of unknown function (DUF6064)